jgi:hypothetical protein
VQTILLPAPALKEHMQGVRGRRAPAQKNKGKECGRRRAPAHQEHMQGDDDDTAMMILCGAGVCEQQRQRRTCKECGRRRAPAPKEHMQGVRGRRAPAHKNKGKDCEGGHGPQTVIPQWRRRTRRRIQARPRLRPLRPNVRWARVAPCICS